MGNFNISSLFLPGLGSSAEHLVFVQDEAEDSGNDFLSSESTDSSIPWFLRVQELAHDSLIAATRAQLAKNAKTSSNGETPVEFCSFPVFCVQILVMQWLYFKLTVIQVILLVRAEG